MSPSMTRILSYNYAAVDIDLGEMFINFPLVKFFQQYSGVDLSPMVSDLIQLFPDLKSQVKNKKLFAVWIRDSMGFFNERYNAAL